jgi:hypothetical protein
MKELGKIDRGVKEYTESSLDAGAVFEPLTSNLFTLKMDFIFDKKSIMKRT